MTAISFPADVHGSEISWSKVLNGGGHHEADSLVDGGRLGLLVIHQGGNKHRINLFDLVFEKTDLASRERLHRR